MLKTACVILLRPSFTFKSEAVPLFEPYIDIEYLNIIEYIRTRKNIVERLKRYIKHVPNAMSIRLNVLLADFDIDLGRIRAERPEVINIKENIKFLEDNLEPTTVPNIINAIDKAEISSGEILRVRSARQIIGPEFIEKTEIKTLPLEGSFLEYNPMLNAARIMGVDHLQGELVDVTDAGNKRFILRAFFRDVKGAQSFFLKDLRPKFSEVFGIIENVPTYTSKIEGTAIAGELSLGILVALLRVEVEPEPAVIRPQIKVTEIPVRTSGNVYAPSAALSGTVSVYSFSTVAYQPCFICPRCGYKYVPFIVPTRCPACGFESQ